MGVIELADVNEMVQDKWEKTKQVAAATRAPMLEWLEMMGGVRRSSSGDLPKHEVETDLGHTGSGTHDEGGNFGGASEPTKIEPGVVDLFRMDEVVQVTLTGKIRFRGSTTKTVAAWLAPLLNCRIRQRMKLAAFLVSNAAEGAGNANAPNGIDQFCTATGTVMGQNLASVAGFRPHVNTTGGALSLAITRDVRDTVFVTNEGSFDAGLGPAKQVYAAAALAVAATPTKIIDVGAKETPVPIITGRRPYLTPECYVDQTPYFLIPGATAGRLNYVTIGFEKGGFELVIVDEEPEDKAPQYVRVANSPNYVATCLMHGFTRCGNPKKHMGAATGLT